jgi:hypothetical protein
LRRDIKVTIYISDITELELILNEVNRITENHPYVVINIEVGRN